MNQLHDYTKQIIILFGTFLLLSTNLNAQLNDGGTTQNDLIVCETQTTSSFSFSVGSDFTGDITLDYTLPAGIMYIDASAVVDGDGTLNTQSGGGTSTPQIVVSPDEAGWTTGENVTITITREAGCAVVGEGNQQDMVTVSGGFGADQMFSTDTYNVDEAALSLSLNPVTINSSVGMTECREITVGQGGNGYVTSFTHTVTVGASLSNYVLSFPVTGGTALTPTTTTPNMDGSTTLEYTIDLTAAPFSATSANEDGNGQFENGESFVLQECFLIDGCDIDDVTTTHQSSWGCFSAVCQQTPEASGAVDVAFTAPSITRVRQDLGSRCYGIPENVRTIEYAYLVSSTGGGINVQSICYGVFESGGTGNPSTGRNIFRIDETTIEVKVGEASAYMPTSSDGIDNVTSTNGRPLQLDDFPVAAEDALETPLRVNPGDTIFVRFDYYAECLEDAFCNGRVTSNPPNVKLKYTNDCNEGPFTLIRSIGQNFQHRGEGGDILDVPAQLADGQEGCFALTKNDIRELGGPDGSNRIIRFTVNLPIGLVPDEASATMDGQAPTSSNFDPATGEWVLEFTGLSTSASSRTVRFKATPDCSLPGAMSGTFNIDYTYTYFPNGTSGSCNLESCGNDLYCNDFPIDITGCGILPCPTGGGVVDTLSVARINFGFQDSDGNGVADNKMTADPTVDAGIRTDRFLACDTMKIFVGGSIVAGTNPPDPSFPNAYFNARLDHLEWMTAVDASVQVFDNDGMGNFTMYSTAAYEATDILRMDQASTEGNFELDLSPAQLIALGSDIPANFEYADGDSVAVCLRYRLSALSGITINTVNTYLSQVETNIQVSPDAGTTRYACQRGIFNTTIIGMDYVVAGSNNRDVFSGCDRGGSSARLDLRFGAGFPFESRDLYDYQQLIVSYPDGWYEFDLLSFGGTNILPDMVIDNTSGRDSLIFNVAQYFECNGGSIYGIADENFQTSAIFRAFATCKAQEEVDGFDNEILYSFIKNYRDCAPNNESIGVNGGQVPLRAVSIQTQALPQSQLAATQEICYSVTVENITSNAKADSVFLAFESPSGALTVTSVTEGGMEVLPNSNGIYELETFTASTTRNFEVCIQQNVCQEDSLIIYSGFGCTFYPESIADQLANGCSLESSKVFVTPLPSQIQLQITDQPAAPVDPCSPFTVEVEINSAQASDVVDPNILVGLPVGVGIVSATVEYPAGSGNIEPITGTMISTDSVLFDLTDASTIVGDSLPGTETTLNPVAERQVVLNLSLETGCDFSPGTSIDFTVLGNRPCGDPATGNGERTSSNPIQYAINSELAANVSIDVSGNTTITCEGNTASANLIYIDTRDDGSDLTIGDRDTVTIRLPAGVMYVPSSFMATTANSPTFVEVKMEGGVEVIVLKVPNGTVVPDGSSLSTSFSFDLILDDGAAATCGAVGELDILYTTTSDPIFCQTLVPAGNCPNDLVTTLNRDRASFTLEKVSIENLILLSTNLARTEVSGSFSIASSSPDLATGESLTFEVFCEELTTPIGTTTINGPIAAGTANIPLTVSINPTGCSSTSNLTLVAPTTTSAGQDQCLCEQLTSETIVLPVELTDFSADLAANCTIYLNWETASETNNSHFEVQHSTDTKAFTAIAKVKGAGTTLEKQSYQFMHEEVKAGINYYRLKQVDIDGRYEYSKIVSVQQDCQQKAALEVYPVPVERGQLLNVRYLSHQANTNFRILNMQGQVVLVIRPQSVAQQWNDLKIDLSKFASGVYYLIGSDGLSQRFVVIEQ